MIEFVLGTAEQSLTNKETGERRNEKKGEIGKQEKMKQSFYGPLKQKYNFQPVSQKLGHEMSSLFFHNLL